MKTTFKIIVFLLLAGPASFAQNKPYRVVFDMTSKDTVDHRMVMRWVDEELQSHPEAMIEVVFFGKSLDMLVQGKSIAPEAITVMAQRKNVTFNVCAVAMKNNKIEKSQLLPGIKIVPDGIFEIVSKQNEGWGYIKVSH